MLDVNALSPHGNSLAPNLDNAMDADGSHNINNSVQTLLKNATGFQNGNESQNSAATATAVAAAAFNSFMNAAHLNSALFASTSNVLGVNNGNLCPSPISNASCNGVFNNNLLKSTQLLANRDENGG